MRIKDWINKFFATFPVIGTHMGIEADLLLAGTKPLGWVYVPSDELKGSPNPEVQKDLADIERLDAAVKAGRLISKDVIQQNPCSETLFRHYAQAGNEKNLDLAVVFNQAAFNRKPVPAPELDTGKLLGYRARDRWLWENIGRLPKIAQDAIIFMNKNVTRDAYQADAARVAQKMIRAQAQKASL